MDIEYARRIIERVAESQGVSAEHVVSEIERAISDGMRCPNPVVQARWNLIPRTGAKPNAYEFLTFMGMMAAFLKRER